MAYDFAQTFYVDSAAVKGSPQVNISAVELYFKAKPKRGDTANPNKSGLVEPGVTLLFCGTNMDGTPNALDVKETARLEYNQIIASSDGSAASKFIFEKEVYCSTNKTYCVIARFDANEDFDLWTDKRGSYYLGSNLISPGVTDKYIGNLYISQNRPRAENDPSAAGGPGAIPGTGSLNESWVAKNDEDIKFTVFVARYRTTNSTSNSVVSNNHLLPQSTYEYILFDRKRSQKGRKANKGELVFQNAPLYNNNGTLRTVNVQKNVTTVTSNNVDFTAVFPSATNNNYIVFVSGNHDPGDLSGFTAKYNIRRVVSVQDANSIILETPPSFTNSVSNFMVTAVGEVDFLDRSKAFDTRTFKDSWYFGKRIKQDFLVLKRSSANLSHRFVNNSVEDVIINNGGSGYQNSDYIVITSNSGVGSANVYAYANLTTNSTGGITSTFVTNIGSGMISTPIFSVANSTGGSSSGTSANLSFVEGPFLLSQVNKFKVADYDVINFEVDAVTPQFSINNPSGTSYKVYHQLAYYKDNNGNYVVNQNASSNKKLIKNLKKNDLPYNNTPVLMSRSNELYLLSQQSGNDVSFDIGSSSNNDFVAACVDGSAVIFHKNVINNDYTDEHTSFGNAAAKHISTKITFQEGRLAEDLLVYLRAYRPTSTDIKVYGRMYNSADPEAFDDKDWTLLTCITGADQYSSPTDKKDIREFVYNVPQFPNTQFTSTGTVTLQTGSATVTGVGTAFTSQVGGFAANDLVKIYNPLFPNNHFISSVLSVGNSTSLTLTSTTANSSLLGSGLKIDKLKFPHQGYRNMQNDNVFRYYNTSMHVYDGFDTFAIKIVMLSSNSLIVPQIEDARAIGVSA